MFKNQYFTKNHFKYILVIPLIVGVVIYLIKLPSFVTSPAICNITPTSVPDLPIPPKAQESNNWCWAASLEMVIDYYNPALNISQCQIATKRIELFPPSDWRRGTTPTLNEACTCTPQPSTTITDVDCKLFNSNNGNCSFFKRELKTSQMIAIVDTLLTYYGLKGIPIPNGRRNTLSIIKDHLSLGHPIIGFYLNYSLKNHIVIIKGFTDIEPSDGSTISTGSYLFINNPLNDSVANCKSCYHWILTDCDGNNNNQKVSKITGGTYRRVAYLAVTNP